jgi:putative ABC transport system permease protein
MIRLSGRYRSALIIGGQGIRARKLRTLLSMVSLFLGVLAVVVVQAGAEIAQHAVLAEAELTQGRDGTLQMYLPPDAKTVPVTLDTLRGRTDAVAILGTQAIIGEPGVNPVNPGAQPFDQTGGSYVVCDPLGRCSNNPGQSSGNRPQGMAIELSLVAVTGDVRQFRPFPLDSGRWLDFSSAPSLSPRIVLNKKAAVGFARYKVPAQMHIDGATADPTPRIVGVVDDAGYQPTAYVRADELQNWMPETALGFEGQGGGGGVQVLMAPTATDVEKVLRSRLVANGVPAERLQSQQVNARKDAAKMLALMRWVFLGMAGLVLLIGVAGILNVGLATVGERVEEFALRRAVGTPRSLLAGIVLAETLLTGLLTAGAAIGVGVVGVKIVSALFGGQQPFLANLEFPWQAGVAGVVAGLIAGLLGGFVPAVRAARIPIATVMRA